MSKLLIIIIALFIAFTACSQIPELQPELVFKANYGDSEDEYGYVGIVERDDSSPVAKLYVSTDRIYIHDRMQDNIKVYDLSGNYIRTISAMWEKDGMQCGHYVSRDKLATRYDEDNARVQCCGCNVFKKGNYPVYSDRLIKEKGSRIIGTLNKRSVKEVRRTSEFYEKVIKKYTKKIENL